MYQRNVTKEKNIAELSSGSHDHWSLAVENKNGKNLNTSDYFHLHFALLFLEIRTSHSNKEHDDSIVESIHRIGDDYVHLQCEDDSNCWK